MSPRGVLALLVALGAATTTVAIAHAEGLDAPDPAAPRDLLLTARLTPVECPDGVVNGIPRWYGEQPPARDPYRRAAVLSAPLRRAHPGAGRQVVRRDGALQLTWSRPDGLRVGRLVLARLGDGDWAVREWEWC